MRVNTLYLMPQIDNRNKKYNKNVAFSSLSAEEIKTVQGVLSDIAQEVEKRYLNPSQRFSFDDLAMFIDRSFLRFINNSKAAIRNADDVRIAIARGELTTPKRSDNENQAYSVVAGAIDRCLQDRYKHLMTVCGGID